MDWRCHGEAPLGAYLVAHLPQGSLQVIIEDQHLGGCVCEEKRGGPAARRVKTSGARHGSATFAH